MSDDFGTMNIRSGDRTRELELLRQELREHRDALTRLTARIDATVARLDEMAGAGDPSPRANTLPGDRPIAAPPRHPARSYDDDIVEPPPTSAVAQPRGRMALMVAGGVIVLAIIGWLILRASGDRRSPRPITETTATQPVVEGSETPAAPVTPAPTPAAAADAALRVVPAVADYGAIRKGTRAVRQFEVTNSGTTPITISVARSQCRCLYYDYKASIAPKAKETVTVTIDGAKAKAGALNETVQVTAKENPAATASLGIQATIK